MNLISHHVLQSLVVGRTQKHLLGGEPQECCHMYTFMYPIHDVAVLNEEIPDLSVEFPPSEPIVQDFVSPLVIAIVIQQV